MKTDFDVIIIGGGVVGSAVARELSRYKLGIAVLEKELDVVNSTSGHNTGLLHSGALYEKNSLKMICSMEGNADFDRVAEELDVPFKRCGKLVVGFGDEERERLEKLYQKGLDNGVPGLRMIDHAELKSIEPSADGDFALVVPTAGILCPFTYTIALAENAAMNGAKYFFDHAATGIDRTADFYTVHTAKGDFTGRWVINCAGLFAYQVSKWLGFGAYEPARVKGEYIILDQKVGQMLPLPAYPVPNPKEGGLGIHLTPSVDGNVFVGPSNEYLDDADDYSATQSTMDMLIEDGSRIFPYLKREYFIRNFAGIRPKLASKTEGGYRDFVVERREDKAPWAVNLVGIESPGLTSAVPISREIVRLMTEKEELIPNPDFDPIRKGIVTFHDKTPEEQAALIEQDPDYGEIVCRCECITKAEVLQAIRNPLGVHTVTGVKYRCRTMMGRCQGGYCQTRVTEMIMQETGCKREEVVYNRDGSYLFTGKVREDG